MSIPRVAQTTPTGPLAQAASAKPTDSGIGKQAFLQLLLTQLRNQDPLKPMEDREFIAQLAQFNTLEQMQAVQKTLVEVLLSQQLTQATGLLGKTVAGKTVAGQDFTARVNEVRNGANGPLLVTDAGQVALKDVTRVV